VSGLQTKFKNFCKYPWVVYGEEFENGGFALKTRQVFSVHATAEKSKDVTTITS